jgi:hypothetical protein
LLSEEVRVVVVENKEKEEVAMTIQKKGGSDFEIK